MQRLKPLLWFHFIGFKNLCLYISGAETFHKTHKHSCLAHTCKVKQCHTKRQWDISRGNITPLPADVQVTVGNQVTPGARWSSLVLLVSTALCARAAWVCGSNPELDVCLCFLSCQTQHLHDCEHEQPHR